MVAKVYYVDPLVCLRGGPRMNILAFVSDQRSISRILERLGLRSWCSGSRPTSSRAASRSPSSA
jgi:hypothetical protein